MACSFDENIVTIFFAPSSIVSFHPNSSAALSPVGLFPKFRPMSLMHAFQCFLPCSPGQYSCPSYLCVCTSAAWTTDCVHRAMHPARGSPQSSRSSRTQFWRVRSVMISCDPSASSYRMTPPPSQESVLHGAKFRCIGWLSLAATSRIRIAVLRPLLPHTFEPQVPGTLQLSGRKHPTTVLQKNQVQRIRRCIAASRSATSLIVVPR